MSSDPPISDRRADPDRLTALETVVMHLQHEVEQLHEVLLTQGAALTRMRADLARLEHALHGPTEPPEVRDPLAEKPPHY